MTPAGTVIWITGLPASGKSTFARRVQLALGDAGRAAIVLDGDEVRAILGADGYEAAARDAFYRALGRLAALVANQGLTAVVPATAPRRTHRDDARACAPAFVEVWIRAPIGDCESRDFKGLYQRARSGEIESLPGLGAPYEAPTAPEVIADGGLDDRAVAATVQLATTRQHPRA
jgi:adenylylsulfate kinase